MPASVGGRPAPVRTRSQVRERRCVGVIQSPIIDGYRTLYQDGLHYNAGWWGTPALYQSIDAIPPAIPDITNGRTQYVAGFATGTDPACWAKNIALQDGLHDHDDKLGFWRERDLPGARGSTVPTFWSHGFLDVNTKPDNFVDVWKTLTGPNHGWFGQFAHTRPNEPGVGRSAYYWEELFSFLDEELKGEQGENFPAVEVEDNTGRWRAEAQWPPADASPRDLTLRSGTYTDRTNAVDNIWSISAPLEHDAWIAGVPTADVDVTTTVPNASVIVRVWDIAEDGFAEMISFGGGKAKTTGQATKSVELYPADHVVAAGHHIGVQVLGHDSQYLPIPSGQSVTVRGGALHLPFLRFQRKHFLPGEASTDASGRRSMTVGAATIAASGTPFDAPPPLAQGGGNGNN